MNSDSKDVLARAKQIISAYRRDMKAAGEPIGVDWDVIESAAHDARVWFDEQYPRRADGYDMQAVEHALCEQWNVSTSNIH